MKRMAATHIHRESSNTNESLRTISILQLGETLEEINNKTPDLRDYLATKAMAAISSNGLLVDKIIPEDIQERIASISYKMADAMLEARKK